MFPLSVLLKKFIREGRLAIYDARGQRHAFGNGSGEPFAVSIRIALPAGREVNVGHTPGDDERLTDLTAAVNAAFKRALRQLTDETDQMEGRVKRHSLGATT